MFDGEMASLIAIAATNTVKVPKPVKVLNNPKGGSSIVLEYLEMKGIYCIINCVRFVFLLFKSLKYWLFVFFRPS